MSEQALNAILDRLNQVTLQLKEVTGFHHDSYAKKVEDIKNKHTDAVENDKEQSKAASDLTAKEKSRYRNISKEFEKILNVNSLKSVLNKIEDKISSQIEQESEDLSKVSGTLLRSGRSLDNIHKAVQSLSRINSTTSNSLQQILSHLKKGKKKTTDTASIVASLQKVINPTAALEKLSKTFNIAPVTDSLKQVKNLLGAYFADSKQQERAKRVQEVRKPTIVPRIKEPTQDAGALSKLLKGLGLGALLGLLGGAAMLISNTAKLGSVKDIMQFVGKYASLAGLKTIIASASTFLHVLTTPFQLLSKLFTGKAITELAKEGVMKLGGDFFAKALPNLTKILGRGLKFLKPIPLLGSVISFYLAYESFKKDDVTDGLFEIASGLASFIPGIGTAISIGIDLINIARKVSAEEAGKQAGESVSFLDTLKTVGGGVISTVAEWFSKLPIIRNLIEAVQALKTGDKKGALRAIGLEWLVSKNDNEFFDSGKITQLKDSIRDGMISFFETLGGWFSTFWDNLLAVKEKVFGFFQNKQDLKKSVSKDLTDSAGLQVVSSLNSQLSKLSEIATILNNQYTAMLENNKLLQQIIYNTSVQLQKPTTQVITNSPTEGFFKEESSYTRKSYINDFKQLNAYVRESFA